MRHVLIFLALFLPTAFAADNARVSYADAPAADAQPELVLQTGHSKAVQSVAFAADGSWLASGSYDNTIRIWDPETGREIRSLIGHGGVVTTVASSPDSKLLASGSNDSTVRLWNIESGLELKKFEGAEQVTTLAFSPDGASLACGGSAGTIIVRSVVSGIEIARLTGIDRITALAFAPDGRTLVSGASDGSVRVWDAVTGKLHKTLTGNTTAVLALAITADNLAVADEDKTIRWWSTADWRRRGMFTVPEAPLLLDLRAKPRLRTVYRSGSMQIWDLSVAKPALAETTTIDISQSEVESAALNGDGKLLAIGTGAGTVTLADVERAKVVRTLENHTVGYYGVAFSSDSQWLASAAFDNTVKLWDLTTGRALPPLRGHTGRVTAVVFHPDNRRVISSSIDHTIRVWDLITGKTLTLLKGHSNSVSSLAVSNGGRFLVSGSQDQTVGVWDLGGASAPRFITGHKGEVVTVAVSPDDKFAASGSVDGDIRVWDTSTWQTVTILSQQSEVDAVAFSPDGKLIASAGVDKKVRVWDTGGGQVIQTIEGHDAKINSIAFGPDGKSLLTASQDRTVRVWDLSDKAASRVLNGHTGTVYQAGYSPDGQFICSASDDGSVIIWRAAAGQKAATLVSVRDRDNWLAVTPEGFFDGSPAAWAQISWRFEMSTFNTKPVEVFFDEFYAPGLLSDILNGRKLPDTSNISRKDRRQPVVNITRERTVELSPGRRAAEVDITVSKAPAGARDVRLFRNGALVRIWRGDVLKGQSETQLHATIPLTSGENVMTAYAFNNDNIKSSDATLNINGPADKPRKGTAYFLAIGINQYSNSEYNLKYAGADADDFVQELTRQQTALKKFDAMRVISLKDDQATKNNIIAALHDLASKIEPEDILVIYYAGHGTAYDKRFYLIPHDIEYSGTRDALDAAGLKTILSHSISDRELESAVEGLDASRIVMVIDACNSGQALEADDKRLGPMNSKGLAQLAYEKGMYILTATQSYQAAQEATRLGHGFLTYALVEEGLKTSAADRDPADGQIVLREWLDFAAQRVPEIQEDDIKGRQLDRETSKKAGGAADIQRPRVFYRRDVEREPLVIAGRIK